MNAPLVDLHAIHAAHLRAMCAAIRDRLAATPSTAGFPDADPEPLAGLDLPPLLTEVANRFGLTAFEAELMALALAVEIDPAVAGAVRRLQPEGDPRPSFALGFTTLTAAHWSALSPDRPLLRWQLLRAEPAALLAHAPLTLNPRLLHALVGVGTADAALEIYGRQLGPAERLSDAQIEVAEALSEVLDSGPAQLFGGAAGDREAILRHAAGLRRRMVWRFAEGVPEEPTARLRLARLIERESALTGMVPLLEVAATPQALRLAYGLDAPFVLSAEEPCQSLDRPLPAFEAPDHDFFSRRQLWQAAAPAEDAEDLDRLANDFALDAQAISEIGTVSDSLAKMRQAARRRCRVELNGLATRRIPRATWDDLALRPGQRASLSTIIDRIRHQPKVLRHWGFGAKSGRGTGVTALFTGPSGTGKTLAADVIAAELELDLLHVDLSCVVSKWLGETEKNLDRIFAIAERGGVVLLFDEADALFGKRSDVKDSRDRYANLEVSFLLQRIEAFSGLALLTTNQQTALDEAFLRRIGVLVNFAFPDVDLRQDIWTRIQPADAPVEALDAARLAQIAASGGEIRNMALGAAYAAAGRGAESITMVDLQAAADTELAKLGRPRAVPSRGGDTR